MPIKDPGQRRDSQRRYNAAHKEEIREYQRKWNRDHREEKNAAMRKARAESPDRFREHQIKYRQKHREEILRRLRERNRTDDYRAYQKQWNQSNQDKRRAYEAAYRNKPDRRIFCLVSAAKRRANKWNREFNEDIRAHLVSNPATECACCGAVLDYSTSKGAGKANSPRSPSLDRIDNTRGYTVDNVAIICYRCNTQKGDATIAELLRIAEYMRKHL